ncbi:MAG: cyoE [Burkholderiales bacterium]|nr:cyoE [Burkholderiales bacterium]
MIKKFYTLTKPGIIFGNLITTAGGFFLGSRGNVNYVTLLSALLGISLVVACGCVFNNIIDRDIDRLMERTKNRALVQGLISVRAAFIYGLILGLSGFLILYLGTNLLAVAVAFIGLLVYVGIYSLWLKRYSIYGTLIGSISGAVPPVVGYLAASGHFDIGALILFFILSIWQIPHSYAIAIYRFNDYANAKIPVLPVVKGIFYAKIQILVYVIAFVIATLMLTLLKYTGYMYFITALVLGIFWIRLSIVGFYAKDDKKWARKNFLFSVICITILSIMMSIDVVR